MKYKVDITNEILNASEVNNKFPNVAWDFSVPPSDDALAAYKLSVYTDPPPAPPTFAQNKTTFILKIDADVDAVYQAVVGNRSDEYKQAYDDATAFKAAGYTGTAPASVHSWALAKSWTDTQSADDILLAATRLAGLRDALRAQRLSKKELAKAAADQNALNTVMSQWGAAIAAIRTSAGV